MLVACLFFGIASVVALHADLSFPRSYSDAVTGARAALRYERELELLEQCGTFPLREKSVTLCLRQGGSRFVIHNHGNQRRIIAAGTMHA